MSADLSLDSILKMAEIATVIGSVAIGLVTFGRSASRMELKLAQQSNDIGDMKQDLKKLNEVMTTVALQAQRMDMLGERLNMLDKRYDELRGLSRA